MLRLGNIFENILVLLVLAGMGYIIYLRVTGNKPNFNLKSLFSKTDLRGDKNFK
jgi:hypothetical protein|tara:strand:- start:119 stop:280 length:162 start_codon:yes stop_codon:yes gene_type:complete